jgi:MFS family permease
MTARIQSTLRQTFLSLRTRNFRLFFIGQSISNSGNWLTNVALTLLILHLTGSGLYVGLLTACQFGPILLLSIWGGAIADRSNKRNLLFITQSLEMAESVALAALAFTHNPPIWAFFMVATVGGILLAFDNPLRRSFVTEMVPAEDIPNAVVLYSTIINVARIVGPALAGALIATVGYGWCFTVDAISYIAVLTCLWMMRPEELRRREPKPRVKGEIRAGLQYVLSVPVLWISFVMLFIIGSLAYNFTVTLPLFVTKSLHGNASTFTLIYSVFGFGALIGALLVANRRLVYVRSVIASSLAVGVVMLILAGSPSVITTLPIVLALGITSIIYMTSTTSIVQVEAKPSMHGRVLALQSVLLVGTTPIGGPLLGGLADIAGGRLPILIGGVACLLAGLFGYLAAKRHQLLILS